MNFHLTGAKMLNSNTFDSCGSNMFIRGNVVMFVHLNKSDVDLEPLTLACKKQHR